MNLSVVGSVGLDDVETPFGKVELALGGSASYFSLAASFFGRVGFVGIVGDDFPRAPWSCCATTMWMCVACSGLQVRPSAGLVATATTSTSVTRC